MDTIIALSATRDVVKRAILHESGLTLQHLTPGPASREIALTAVEEEVLRIALNRRASKRGTVANEVEAAFALFVEGQPSTTTSNGEVEP